MHNMPVVSECKLNQVGIVGEPLSTSVQCPEIPLSASFLPSFLPSLSQIVFWDPDNIFFDAYPTFNRCPPFASLASFTLQACNLRFKPYVTA